MKKFLLVSFAFLSLPLVAQTTHHISVLAMSYSPNALTIEVGDSVVFTNTSGTHNVNGTTTTFPSNPESFGNTSGPAGWVYGHKFDVAGSYDYMCDVHGVGMSGTINVVNGLSVPEKTTNFAYSIYPNPANALLNVQIDANLALDNTVSVALYDLTGKQVARVERVQNHITPISLENLENGIYFCSIYQGGKLLATEKIVRF